MPDLNSTFAALADPTRRAILARLALGGGITVMELAGPFAMKLNRPFPGTSKCLKKLA